MEDHIRINKSAMNIIPNQPDLWLAIDTFRRAVDIDITPELEKHLSEMLTSAYHTGWQEGIQSIREAWGY